MNKKFKIIQKEFTQKNAKLESARFQLKKEYIGIDAVIDEVINNVRSWYTMNALQDKPAIINLWGLTGVGKTSLIIRLMELLSHKDYTYRVDLGQKTGTMSFNSTINDLCENKQDAPVVIMLDEFQHAKTVSGPFRKETENDHTRLVWELIDSGKVSFLDWKRKLVTLEEITRKLKKLIKTGVVVKEGLVVKNKPLYDIEIDNFVEDDGPLPFFPSSHYETIIELSGKDLKIDLRMDLMEILFELNGIETIEFLEKAIKYAKRPKSKNFTKSLIFILGNIDEAYTMSCNYSADISADEFHRLSMEITIPKMKLALRNRFRDEQIARMGNIHIIYPALNKRSYSSIIQMELNKVGNSLKEMTDISLAFDNSVTELIYNEGVYPTQGVRPLFTTIHQLIKSKLSSYLNQMLIMKINADSLSLSYQDNSLLCSFMKNEKVIYEHKEHIETKLNSLRESKKNEIQAITAVHESGHAVLSAVLLNVIPEIVVSVSSESDLNGFIYSRNSKEHFSKNELIPRAAVCLGGIIAEEIVFGSDNITAGSNSDLHTATSLITRMVKKHGMGEFPISYAITDNEDAHNYHRISGVEEEVKFLMQKSLMLAKETLLKEKKALLTLSEYLSNHSKIEKSELKFLLSQHLNSVINDKKDSAFFRNRLMKEVARNTSKNNEIVLETVVLNKKSGRKKAS